MPASSVFLAFLAEQAAGLVVRHARGVLTRMPWARDAKRVEMVERKIAVLVDRVATLARNVPVQTSEPLLEPLLQDFRRELLAEKISEAEANEIVDSVRAQIRTEVLRPLEDAAVMLARLETLESENETFRRDIEQLERTQTDLVARVSNQERESRRYLVVATIAMTLALLATVLGLITLGRR